MHVTPHSAPAGGELATVLGATIPPVPDPGRMRRDRSQRLRDAMGRHGIDALVLLGTASVRYATGAPAPAVDASRSALLRPVALVLVDDPEAHLFTPYLDAALDRVDPDHLHPPLHVDLDEAADGIAQALARHLPSDAVLACDEVTAPLRRALGDRVVGDGTAVVGAARIVKTPDELAAMRTAQRTNEVAMGHVQAQLRAGQRQSELTGRFLRRAFEEGASGIGIDPIWQVMPSRRSDGPWTYHGDVAYPTPSGDQLLREGDVVWVDSGILHDGYPSDFGRTWLVDAEPSPRQRDHFSRWAAVMAATLDQIRPGATGGDLCRAARRADPPSVAEGRMPWLEQFYLVHGLGLDPAEMPFFGTDLGAAFDDAFVLAPGMVLVLEPVIWEDGFGGYRSEDLVVVTDDGWAPLSDHTYAPFAEHAPWGAGR